MLLHAIQANILLISRFFFPGPYGAWTNTTQLAKYLIAFYFKPSNEVYSLFPIKQLQMKGNISGLNEIAKESVVKVLHH